MCHLTYSYINSLERERESCHTCGVVVLWDRRAWLICWLPTGIWFPHVASTSLICLHETPLPAIKLHKKLLRLRDWGVLGSLAQPPYKVLRIHFPFHHTGRFFIRISSLPPWFLPPYWFSVGDALFSSDAMWAGLYHVCWLCSALICRIEILSLKTILGIISVWCTLVNFFLGQVQDRKSTNTRLSQNQCKSIDPITLFNTSIILLDYTICTEADTDSDLRCEPSCLLDLLPTSP